MAKLLAASIAIAITLLVAVPSALADAALIAQVCKGIENHPNCVDVFNSDPRSVNATTNMELGSITLDLCTATCREGSQRSEDEKAKHDEDAVLQALGSCADAYYQVTDTLEEARTDFGNGDYHNASDKVGEASEAGENYEKAFADNQVKSVMADVNQRMSDTCDICWQIIEE